MTPVTVLKDSRFHSEEFVTKVSCAMSWLTATESCVPSN